MTDIETRKAAAKQWFEDNTISMPVWLLRTLKELLSPSPPVAAGEVDSDAKQVISDLKYYLGDSPSGVEDDYYSDVREPINTIIEQLYFYHRALKAALKAQQPRQEWRTYDKWHDDYGCVMWHLLPVCEPPYVGSPLCSSWPYDYTGNEKKLRWTKLLEPPKETR